MAHINKTVYILMATYNGEKYIKEQIDSIINQTYKNWRLIIHDDGSTDKTNQILSFYKKQYENKINIISNDIAFKNVTKNFLFLLDSVSKEKFDYIMFSDQDDIWLPYKIEKTLQKMMEIESKHKNVPVLVHTDLAVVNEKLQIIAHSMVKYQKILLANQENILHLAIENCITGCTMMINKQAFSLIKHYNGLCADMIIMYDWWLSLLVLNSGGKINFLNFPTILYRQHSHNVIGAKNIGIGYYISRLAKPATVLYRYKIIKGQAKCFNIKIGIFIFIYKKIIFAINKIIKAF